MLRHIYILFAFILVTTCDDGDIITVNLDFDKSLSMCTNNTDSFLIYDLKSDPNESLSVIIPRATNSAYPFTQATSADNPITFNINGSTNRFIYRTYNRTVGNSELCEAVPPADLNIVEDYEANDGIISANVTILDDDNDGVPNEFEGITGMPDENGIYLDALDTDNDGIPNYLDEDDDNDNVKTIHEINNSDGDNDPTTNPLNSDANSANPDTIPDYLDTDDDGDGIATILEDEDQDKNPRNDTNIGANNNLIAHYLNDQETTNYGNPGLVGGNTYTRNVSVNFSITNFNLEIISSTELDFGVLTYTFDIVEEE